MDTPKPPWPGQENCEPPLKKMKESKPELICERTILMPTKETGNAIHGFNNDLGGSLIRTMPKTWQ